MSNILSTPHGFSRSLVVFNRNARGFDRRYYCLGITLAKEKLGWAPMAVLEEGTKKCMHLEGSPDDLH